MNAPRHLIVQSRAENELVLDASNASRLGVVQRQLEIVNIFRADVEFVGDQADESGMVLVRHGGLHRRVVGGRFLRLDRSGSIELPLHQAQDRRHVRLLVDGDAIRELAVEVDRERWDTQKRPVNLDQARGECGGRGRRCRADNDTTGEREVSVEPKKASRGISVSRCETREADSADSPIRRAKPSVHFTFDHQIAATFTLAHGPHDQSRRIRVSCDNRDTCRATALGR